MNHGGKMYITTIVSTVFLVIIGSTGRKNKLFKYYQKPYYGMVMFYQFKCSLELKYRFNCEI